MDQTTINIRPELFWGTISIVALVLAVLFIFWVLLRVGERESGSLDNWKRWLGGRKVDSGLFALIAILWGALVLVLGFGLFFLIWEVLWHAVPSATDDSWNFRFKLAQLVALTGVFGAIVAFPVSLNRLKQTQDQTRTAEESLFNDKITEAASDLYAQRQVTIADPEDGGKKFNAWEDDITRRNAAIDRLEGLVKERPDVTERVSRLLSVYVRELSREHPAQKPPQTDNSTEIRRWASTLTPVRSDMENAVQVLGWLNRISGKTSSISIDLRGANLQGFDLNELCFPNKARFENASADGATFFQTDLSDSDFSGCSLKCADLSKTACHGTVFNDADLQSAFVKNSQFDSTDFRGANLSGSFVSASEFVKADFRNAQLNSANMICTLFENCDFSGSRFNKARVAEVRLTSCDLTGTLLTNAELWDTNFSYVVFLKTSFSGAHLKQVAFEYSPFLRGCDFWGAGIGTLEDDEIQTFQPFWSDIFASRSTDTTAIPHPSHWPEQVLHPSEFETRWRAWQQEIGFDQGALD